MRYALPCGCAWWFHRGERWPFRFRDRIHPKDFERAEAEARAAGRGIWRER